VNEPARDRAELKMDYAWGWFSYHAGQRFAAFNFFVVLVGAVAVAYANAETHRSDVLGAGVASLGGFLAFALLMIDFRNAQLVDCGRVELVKVEEGLDISIATAAQERSHSLISHSLWFRAILVVSVGSSILAAIWALNDFQTL
jgi:hypothetical protein